MSLINQDEEPTVVPTGGVRGEIAAGLSLLPTAGARCKSCVGKLRTFVGGWFICNSSRQAIACSNERNKLSRKQLEFRYKTNLSWKC